MPKEPKFDISKFKHSVKSWVKFSDIDAVGVIYNIQYFYWLEWARTEYLKSLGYILVPDLFIKILPVMVVHAEIDYFSSAGFGEEYEILTRTSFIGRTSLGYENIIKTNKSGLVEASATLVNLNPATMAPERISPLLINRTIEYENDNVKMIVKF